MQLEQKEDQAQFKLKNASASIKERRRRGLTWYPVTITQEDIGFGGKVVLELERPAHRQDLHLFQVGAAAALFSNAPGYSGPDRPVVSGVVTRVRRNKLVLATTKEALPDWVLNDSTPNGSSLNGSALGIDLTFDEVSYREMHQALNDVIGAHGNRMAELRDVLLGARQASYREPKADDLFYPSALKHRCGPADRKAGRARCECDPHGQPQPRVGPAAQTHPRCRCDGPPQLRQDARDAPNR